MKLNKSFILVVSLLALSAKSAWAQTYNIPAASSTGSTYLGAATGDLNLRSVAGSLQLNTTGTITVPNIGINTQGNIGIGMMPPLNATSGNIIYEPIVNLKGIDGNNAVPAWSPRTSFRISANGTNNLNLGIFGNKGFIQSNQLAIYSGDVFIGSTDAGGGGVTLTLGTSGNYGSKIESGISGKSELRGSLVVGNISGNSPSTPGLGTSYSLYVAKGILTEKVKVAVASTSNWSDYVFAKEYKLLSLSEVETYIKKHKHLPGLPSAEEVVKEGIDMATMDAKLLEKIEELTLYVIELKKENEVMKKEISELKSK